MPKRVRYYSINEDGMLDEDATDQEGNKMLSRRAKLAREAEEAMVKKSGKNAIERYQNRSDRRVPSGIYASQRVAPRGAFR